MEVFKAPTYNTSFPSAQSHIPSRSHASFPNSTLLDTVLARLLSQLPVSPITILQLPPHLASRLRRLHCVLLLPSSSNISMAFKRLSAILLSACIVPHVSTTPVANTCQPVSDILKILNDPRISASATKFCSSFLSIPLQTVTNVATITAQAPVTTTTATATVSR